MTGVAALPAIIRIQFRVVTEQRERGAVVFRANLSDTLQFLPLLSRMAFFKSDSSPPARITIGETRFTYRGVERSRLALKERPAPETAPRERDGKLGLPALFDLEAPGSPAGNCPASGGSVAETVQRLLSVRSRPSTRRPRRGATPGIGIYLAEPLEWTRRFGEPSGSSRSANTANNGG